MSCFYTLTPGSTAVHTWYLPFDLEDIDKVRVTYQQNGQTIFEYETNEFEAEEEGCSFALELTQEDTLGFQEKVLCKAMLNVLFKDGARVPSKTVTFPVGEQFYEEVME